MAWAEGWQREPRAWRVAGMGQGTGPLCLNPCWREEKRLGPLSLAWLLDIRRGSFVKKSNLRLKLPWRHHPCASPIYVGQPVYVKTCCVYGILGCRREFGTKFANAWPLIDVLNGLHLSVDHDRKLMRVVARPSYVTLITYSYYYLYHLSNRVRTHNICGSQSYVRMIVQICDKITIVINCKERDFEAKKRSFESLKRVHKHSKEDHRISKRCLRHGGTQFGKSGIWEFLSNDFDAAIYSSR
ncbi:hypothetical protein D8674_008508 [Pyrus ussuriensis x Pyrus communis]|uniref:Uncharacterized protein n=1 Tax=Pyrus ussuriensis x Pyrus communis TaxID=2448454 RepID=A0A5N5HT88_9ROSA|nr:hypothetical protein D8674_008508 [Pyrus ussuriensis x Pyrus communis]